MGPSMTSPMAYTLGTLVRKWSSTGIVPRLLRVMPSSSRPRPDVKGRRPVATSTASASSTSGSPPFTGSIVTLTLPSDCTSELVTLVLSLNFMPCFCSSRWNTLRTSPSMGGTILSKNSMTVISDPRRPHTDAISRPMMPPPMTTIFSGIFFREMAPVEETMVSSSTGEPGSGVTSEPVAMMTFLVGMVLVLPSSAVTSTSVPLFNLPHPLAYVTLFFLNSPSIPFVNPVMAPCFCSIILPRSTATSETMMP
mmetsp:Transcript_40456/g.103609  ORF Transcript_40456/g.103609 Transcript_40456/m.103609 type:complete len:252 (-) Transcript_40456:435-1190(-)